MLAEHQERERQALLNMVFAAAPPWPVREKSSVQFAFPHNGGTLLHDRKIVREIMDLRASVENNFPGAPGSPKEHYQNSFKCLGVPLTFHEAFVLSHEQRHVLIARVYKHYDTHWHGYIVDMAVKSFPTAAPGGYVPTLDMAVAQWKTGVTHLYTMAQSTMARQIEAILQMQKLVQHLQLETRQLVTRCADFEELDRSMLWAQTRELPELSFSIPARSTLAAAMREQHRMKFPFNATAPEFDWKQRHAVARGPAAPDSDGLVCP